MNKQIEYTQAIDIGLDAAILMPTFGTASYHFAKKLGLPMTIERERGTGGFTESSHHLMSRAEKKRAAIEKKVHDMAVKAGMEQYSPVWINWKQAKKHHVIHNYSQKARETS